MIKAIASKEPLVILGILFSGALVIIQGLAGEGIIGTDLADTITQAIDPTSGWAVPLIALVIGRFFVFSPAKADELLHTPPPVE